MKKSSVFNGLIGTAALLLPLTAATESEMRAGAPGSALSATAQLNFKVIIPKVLYLRVGGEGAAIEGPNTVAIMSNSRMVALNASLRTAQRHNASLGTAQSDRSSPHPAESDSSPWGNVILSTGGHKAIAQEASCTLDGQPARAGSRLICTASMP